LKAEEDTAECDATTNTTSRDMKYILQQQHDHLTLALNKQMEATNKLTYTVQMMSELFDKSNKAIFQAMESNHAMIQELMAKDAERQDKILEMFIKHGAK